MQSTFTLTGQLFIGGQRQAGLNGVFYGFNPTTGSHLEPAFGGASDEQIDRAAYLAGQAFEEYRATSAEQRAVFLEMIANGIEALGSELLGLTSKETGLPLTRLEGERNRTTGQLRMFADVVRKGLWQTQTFVAALPNRRPLPRQELRSRLVPMGPVAMFGASNFPFAFSVAGGDTAAAFAAGCPVVVKAHPSHPGTSEVIAHVVQAAVNACNLPAGVFSMVAGTGYGVGERLVSHPSIQAVAFTGSRNGGVALCKIAQNREQPIPVYAEMSSVNPVCVLPAALAQRGTSIAKGLVDSVAMGTGQFCTSPGLVLGIASPEFDHFCISVADEVAPRPAGTLLNQGIHASYLAGVTRLSEIEGVKKIAEGVNAQGPCDARMTIFRVDADVLLKAPTLQHEVFGPCSVMVECRDADQMLTILEGLEGQLTASLLIEEDDSALAKKLMPALERKVGRLIINSYPTGVEVSDAMVHGGPFPATSNARCTSVGSRAIERFLRPVCYQNFPDNLLPIEVTT